METFSLRILSPTKPIGELQVRRLLVPGELGYMGLGCNHTDIISMLKPGIIEILGETTEETLRYYVGEGLLDVYKNKATLFLDVIESPTEIDLKRAKEAEDRAVARLKETSRLDINIPRALKSLERARARLRLSLVKDKGHD